MNKIAILEDSKDFFNNVSNRIRYGKKFKQLNIDQSFAKILIGRQHGVNEKEILKIISNSKDQEEFAQNVNKYLKTKRRGMFALVLLLGNLTGKYVFNEYYYGSLKGINIDAFSKENQELIEVLKSHFPQFVMNNNKYKNIFAKRLQVGQRSIKDLSQDLDEKELVEDFEKVLNGEKLNEIHYKPKEIALYIMNVIGKYSKEDIMDNFDFILYDFKTSNTNSLEDRRKRYMLHKNLSNNQLRKLDELGLLKQRLQEMKKEEAQDLLSRIGKIESNLDENITELEDIYGDYEILYRQELVDNLFVPEKDITIIEDFRDLKPQLIHRFLRDPSKFRDDEMQKIIQKIISERTDGNTSKELTEDEQRRLNNMVEQLDVNLNQYRVNYTTDCEGRGYTDSLGLDNYHSDTSNQISASVFDGKEFMRFTTMGVAGIGFNRETLCPDAIAISSNSYKTTNRGINNLEYNEEHEFQEMSSPFSELIKANGDSEIVMHRRGMDFDTKASYIFALIDSSKKIQTNNTMKKINKLREKEGLKVVIYDVKKIRDSFKEQEEIEEKVEK